MTRSTPPASDLGQQLQGLITRAVEGRILAGEVSTLRLTVETLTNDRREPVNEEELAKLINSILPRRAVDTPAALRLARELLQATVITKLPHPVWDELQD